MKRYDICPFFQNSFFFQNIYKNIVDVCLSASSLQSSSKSSQESDESKSQFSDCLVGDVLEEINKLSTKVELGFLFLLFWKI